MRPEAPSTDLFSPAAALPSRGALPRVIWAAAAGTVIEWYDFYIFGSMAGILAEHFYPAGDPTVAFLSTLATFATGFVVRPFGAVFFGRIGDLVGRKYACLVTLVLMGIGTAAIGLIPGYATIGMAAPILLVLMRLLQGLALGGEYGGAAIYVAEHAPDSKGGFYTLVGVSFYIRFSLKESPLFTQLKAMGKTSTQPVRDSLASRRNWRLMLLALLCATAGLGVVWY